MADFEFREEGYGTSVKMDTVQDKFLDGALAQPY